MQALIEHYLDDYAVHKPPPFWVSFFGGPPPSKDLVAACNGLPFTVRVRPDLLTRVAADRLVEAGAIAIELDALSFRDEALKEARRKYRRGLLLDMAKGLRKLGIKTGVVLAPGLPNSSFDSCLEDAAIASELFDTVRLHPVLVYAEAGLRDMHMDGSYTPLEISEAVTVCAAMMDIIELKGVKVIRVGVQPGPDGSGRAVAGPQHSSLREVVEGRRSLRRLHEVVAAVEGRGPLTIQCHPGDETRTRGPFNQNVRTLRADYELEALYVEVDSSLRRGEWRVKGEK